MQVDKTVTFMESSFLHDLLTDEEITDISFNGYSLYYLHNYQGRKLSEIKISNGEVKDFIRQISNLSEKQFSYQSPILDVTAGKYRINAVHNSVARYQEEDVINFAIRIASNKPRITDESGFLTPKLLKFILLLIKNKIPIIIGGITGSGKTEFQKYLIGKMEENTRVIIIDNVLELNQQYLNENIDINLWQADDRNTAVSIQGLVKNALRSNPDWLIVAESRGGEMVEILNSALTGHPIITTIHASSVESMPYRLARMVMMNDKKSEYKEVLNDVFSSFPIHFYLKRDIDKKGNVHRYIDSIMFFDKNGLGHLIYQKKKQQHYYFPLCEELLNLFDDEEDQLFISRFGGSK